MDKVAVLIPCYNEAKTVKKVVEDFKRELSFLAIHGFYHLLGYDHMKPEDEKIMFKKQEEALLKYGIKR